MAVVCSRSGSTSPPPSLMTPASPSSASSSEVDLPPSPRLVPRQHIPVVRVATEPGPSSARLLWGDEDDETLIGLHKARRPPPPKRRGTVAATETMARSASINGPALQVSHRTSPVKMPKSTSFYMRRASTSLLPEERPRPASGSHYGVTVGPLSSSSMVSTSVSPSAGTGSSTAPAGRSEADPETLNAKMCVIGDAGVGKTSLINRYINGFFSGNQPSTIGASLLVKKMVLPEGKINFQLWDTAGQERFRSLAPMYYRDCEAAAIVFDLTNRASFLAVKQWLIQIRKHAQNRDNLVLHFVGAKLDLAPEVNEEDRGSQAGASACSSQRQVSSVEAKELIHQWLCEPEQGDAATSPSQLSPNSPSPLASPTRRTLSPLVRTATEGSRPAFAHRTSFFDFLPGRKALEEPAAPLKPWAVWDYSEVSAKTNCGVEEIFLNTSRRLLVRRNTIKHRQELRHKDSIYLNEAAIRTARPAAPAGYSCC